MNPAETLIESQLGDAMLPETIEAMKKIAAVIEKELDPEVLKRSNENILRMTGRR